MNFSLINEIQKIFFYTKNQKYLNIFKSKKKRKIYEISFFTFAINLSVMKINFFK